MRTLLTTNHSCYNARRFHSLLIYTNSHWIKSKSLLNNLTTSLITAGWGGGGVRYRRLTCGDFSFQFLALIISLKLRFRFLYPCHFGGLNVTGYDVLRTS